jgi:hypothetical protein
MIKKFNTYLVEKRTIEGEIYNRDEFTYKCDWYNKMFIVKVFDTNLNLVAYTIIGEEDKSYLNKNENYKILEIHVDTKYKNKGIEKNMHDIAELEIGDLINDEKI